MSNLEAIQELNITELEEVTGGQRRRRGKNKKKKKKVTNRPRSFDKSRFNIPYSAINKWNPKQR